MATWAESVLEVALALVPEPSEKRWMKDTVSRRGRSRMRGPTFLVLWDDPQAISSPTLQTG